MADLTVRPALVAALLAVSTAAVTAEKPVEELVREIRSRYEAVEEARLRPETVELKPEDEPIAATCTRFFQGGEVVKVHLSIAGEHGEGDRYFYYSGGELVFAFCEERSWRFTGRTLADGRTAILETGVEHRLYLSGGRSIRHLKKELSSETTENLGKRLAAAPNQSVEEPEWVAETLREGRMAREVKNPAALRRLLEGE